MKICALLLQKEDAFSSAVARIELDRERRMMLLVKKDTFWEVLYLKVLLGSFCLFVLWATYTTRALSP